MPQMSPLSWLILFVFFSITLMSANILNFFSSSPKSSPKEISNLKKSFNNWKWL